MIHPLHSCKGKGVKHDRRERKREVVYGFRLAVHDVWRCADNRAIEICKLEARYLFDKSYLGIVSDKTLCTCKAFIGSQTYQNVCKTTVL